MTTPIDKLREALKRIERRSLATEDITEARAALDELAAQLEADRVALTLWREDMKKAEARIEVLRGGLEVIRKHSPSAASRCDADLILGADDGLKAKGPTDD